MDPERSKINPQVQSPFFNLTPELQLQIFDRMEEKDLSVVDRVMTSLTCKLMAIRLKVKRSKLPKALTPGETHADAVKKQRLNFMLRLAPWFDDLSAASDPILRKLSRDASGADLKHVVVYDKIYLAKNGFALCMSCVEFRRAAIYMRQVKSEAAVPTVRWVRCLPLNDTGLIALPNVEEMLFNTTLATLVTRPPQPSWQSHLVDKKRMPLYRNPDRKIKSTKPTVIINEAVLKIKRKAETQGVPPSGQAKKKKISAPSGDIKVARVKTSAPLDSADAEQKAADARRDTVALKKMKAMTGLEECEYLPVDATGFFRMAEVGICPVHFIDPMKLVGL